MRTLHRTASALVVLLGVVHIALAPVFFEEFTMRVMWYVAQGLLGIVLGFLNFATARSAWAALSRSARAARALPSSRSRSSARVTAARACSLERWASAASARIFLRVPVQTVSMGYLSPAPRGLAAGYQRAATTAMKTRR